MVFHGISRLSNVINLSCGTICTISRVAPGHSPFLGLVNSSWRDETTILKKPPATSIGSVKAQKKSSIPGIGNG